MTTTSVQRDIFQRRVAGVAEEMSAALRRSAFSSIIWEMYDYSCALLRPDGVMLAQAETIAAQLGIMEYACRRIDEELPIRDWQEGDVVVCNDPYRGCTHTPDVVLFAPIFANGELVALASTIAHHVDIGGKSPCTTVPDNIEVFGEGLILPPLKLVKAGVEVDEVFRILGANVRMPAASLGDLRAQIAGCQIGVRRVQELVNQYGTAQFAELSAQVLDYSERYMRASIGALAHEAEALSGSARILIEDGVASDDPMEVVCTVRVSGTDLEVDFTGTSPQRANALNCPIASTESMVSYAVKAALAPELAQNGGCVRPLSVRTPTGTILNPTRPAAVGSRHYTQQAVAEVVLRALAPFSAAFSYAGSQIAFPALKAGGFDRRDGRNSTQTGGGRNAAPYFAITDLMGGGAGATSHGDGMNAVDTHGGNCELLSAEVMERVSPIRVVRTELVPDSGGDGEYRGGLAIRRDYELLSDDLIVNAYVQQVSAETSPWGNEGGQRGAPACVLLAPGTDAEESLPCKSIGVQLNAGDVIRLQSSGGGGVGDPAARDPERRASDQTLGLVTD